MNARKFTSAALALVLATSLLAGCSGSKAPKTETPTTAAPAAPAEKVTLEWWGWWASATRMPSINKIVEKWNADHPNTQVKYVYVPFDQILTKYAASVAAGNPPDVVSADLALLPQRASKKIAMELGSLGADAMKDQFVPGLWQAGTFQGKQYSIPWMGDSRFLYYNKDLFAAAGLTDADAPKTWDDLKKVADKLDKKENGKLSVAAFYPIIGNMSVQNWVYNAGGQMFDDRQFPMVNNETAIKTMDWVKSWNDRYGRAEWAAFAGAFGNGANHPFVLKKVAMVVDTPTFQGEALKNNPNLKIGRVPLPTPDGKQHPYAAISSGFGIEIPTGSKHPKEAMEFIKYWTGDAAVVWATEQNDIPANKASLGAVKTPGFEQVVAQMANTSYVQVPVYAPSWVTALDTARDDVISGKKDSKTALTEAQNAITKMIQDNMNK